MFIKSPKVSIIIRVGSEVKYFSETIDSILSQTFTDLEVLVFHHRQSQKPIECYHRWSDRRLRLFFQNNLDPAQIFNLGISKAKGEYLAFLQADDLWHPRKLQKQVFCLDCYPDVGLVHSWLMLLEDGTTNIFKYQLNGWVEAEILERNQIDCSSVMIRRSCLDKVGLFDSKLQTAFDWDMWIRISRYYRFMAIAKPLVYCRQRQRVMESWLSMETDFQATIEKAYKNAPRELLAIKERSYAFVSLSLAWQVLENQNPNATIASNYCRQALEHSSSIGFSGEFLQVSLAILSLQCLKSNSYKRLMSLIRAIASRIQIVLSKFKVLAFLIFDPILSEQTNYGDQKLMENRGLGRLRD